MIPAGPSCFPEVRVVFAQRQGGDLVGEVADLANGNPELALDGGRRDGKRVQLPLFPLEGGNADEDKGAGFVHHPSVQRTHDQVDRLGAARHYGLNLVTVEWSE